jgi:hypothetical protein
VPERPATADEGEMMLGEDDQVGAVQGYSDPLNRRFRAKDQFELFRDIAQKQVTSTEAVKIPAVG